MVIALLQEKLSASTKNFEKLISTHLKFFFKDIYFMNVKVNIYILTFACVL
jgi:hypothetical protein